MRFTHNVKKIKGAAHKTVRVNKPLQRYSQSRRPAVGTTPRGRSSCRLHSRLMGVSGIVPGKIMEWPGTVRPVAL